MQVWLVPLQQSPFTQLVAPGQAKLHVSAQQVIDATHAFGPTHSTRALVPAV
jgi:hypothetical protein